MDVKTFAVEEWMNKYEMEAVYNVAETCVDSLTLEGLCLRNGDFAAGPSENIGIYSKKR